MNSHISRVAVLTVAAVVGVPAAIAVAQIGSGGPTPNLETRALTPIEIDSRVAQAHSSTDRPDWQQQIDQIVAGGGTWAQVPEGVPSQPEIDQCLQMLRTDPTFAACAIVVAEGNGDISPGIYREQRLDEILHQGGYLP